MRRPLLPRLLVGLLAILVLGQGGAAALALDAQGLPDTALLQWLTATAYALFLLVVALFPAELEAVLPRGSRLDLRRGAHYGALVAVSGALFVIVALAGLVETSRLLEDPSSRSELFEVSDAGDLLEGLAWNSLVLVGAPALWIAATQPGRPILRELGLRREGAVRALLLGVFFAFLGLLLVAALVAAATGLAGIELPENERAISIGRALTPLTALLVAVASGFSEEVFFRGWLQPRVGVVAQAVIFAVAHLNYVNVGEVVAVFVLALVFGLLYRATKNLWAPIAAHFAFNLVMLLAAGAAA